MIKSLSWADSHVNSSVKRVTHCRQVQGDTRDVRAPKHPCWSESIVNPVQVIMDVAVRIGLARRPWRGRRFNCHIGIFRECEQLLQVYQGGLILLTHRHAKVIDEQAKFRMPFGDQSDHRYKNFPQQGPPANRLAPRRAIANREIHRQARVLFPVA